MLNGPKGPYASYSPGPGVVVLPRPLADEGDDPKPHAGDDLHHAIILIIRVGCNTPDVTQ